MTISPIRPIAIPVAKPGSPRPVKAVVHPQAGRIRAGGTDVIQRAQVLRKDYHFQERINLIKQGLSKNGQKRVQKAFELAFEAYKNAKPRHSGKPKLEHFVRVAEILRFGFNLTDSALIAASLLHDIVEDTKDVIPPMTVGKLRRLVGREVAALVDGVTKLDESVGDVRTAESLKKLIKHIAIDVRLAVLKLADNLNNMEDQEVFIEIGKPKKITEHAKEAMLYARIAGILGMWECKLQLEKAALRWLVPGSIYDQARIIFDRVAKKSEILVNRYARDLKCSLPLELEQAEVQVIAKPFEELLSQSLAQDIDVDFASFVRSEAADLHQVLVVTPDATGIMKVLATFTDYHGLPVFRRVDNELAFQGPTGYQSLEVSIDLPKHGKLAVSILTGEMREKNRDGVLFALRRDKTIEDTLHQRGYDWREQLSYYLHHAYFESDEILQQTIVDFTSPIIVYTPAGEEVILPANSTVLEAAFAIDQMNQRKGRTKIRPIGLRADYAIVNIDGKRKKLNLNEKAPGGAVVNVRTKSSVKPNPMWLSHVRLRHALTEIEAYLLGLDEPVQRDLARQAMDEYSRPFHTTWRSVRQVKFFGQFVADLAARYDIPGLRNAAGLDLLMGQGKLPPRFVGDAFNAYYSQQIRERKRQKKFTPYMIKFKINQDKPGFDLAFKRELSKLHINNSDIYARQQADGSSIGTVVLQVVSSLQIVQVRNIMRGILRDPRYGGGEILRQTTLKRGKSVLPTQLVNF